MKSLGLVLTLTSCLALVACQGSSVPNELAPGDGRIAGIVGGKATREKSDPAYWSVAALDLKISVFSLQGSKTETSFCTGTLIDKDLILTAAHCLLASEKNPFATVRISGTAFFSQTGEHYEIKQALGHKGYNENVRRDSTGTTHADPFADIALILLEKQVSSPLRPASLPTHSFDQGASLLTRIYGYGAENYMNRLFSTQASENEAEEDDSKMPLRWVDAQGTVTNAQLRYDQSKGKGFCKGDSGGPHFISENDRSVVIAVSSSVTDVSLSTPDWCRRHSVAILVEPFLDWIQEGITTLRSDPSAETSVISK
ncbi:MAG: trypsin-like serine protease [Bdellovibrionaceae bacterium]|nr:trypsin-like serine protease [Pseudobdellovibrionaceae bacterium]